MRMSKEIESSIEWARDEAFFTVYDDVKIIAESWDMKIHGFSPHWILTDGMYYVEIPMPIMLKMIHYKCEKPCCKNAKKKRRWWQFWRRVK